MSVISELLQTYGVKRDNLIVPRVLEVPQGKDFWDLPYSHYRDLAKKKGYQSVVSALIGLSGQQRYTDKPVQKKAEKILVKLYKDIKENGTVADLGNPPNKPLDMVDIMPRRRRPAYNRWGKKVFVDVLPNVVNKVHVRLLPMS